MRALEFITGHVTFKFRYNQVDQLKTNFDENTIKCIECDKEYEIPVQGIEDLPKPFHLILFIQEQDSESQGSTSFEHL